MLLRATAGIAAVLEGASYFGGAAALSPAAWAGAILTTGAGVALLIGFLTPIAGALVALGVSAIVLAVVPAPALHVLDNPITGALVVVVAIASALVGPGAFSLDSYLFGRREIVIPHSTQS